MRREGRIRGWTRMTYRNFTIPRSAFIRVNDLLAQATIPFTWRSWAFFRFGGLPTNKSRTIADLPRMTFKGADCTLGCCPGAASRTLKKQKSRRRKERRDAFHLDDPLQPARLCGAPGATGAAPKEQDPLSAAALPLPAAPTLSSFLPPSLFTTVAGWAGAARPVSDESDDEGIVIVSFGDRALTDPLPISLEIRTGAAVPDVASAQEFPPLTGATSSATRGCGGVEGSWPVVVPLSRTFAAVLCVADHLLAEAAASAASGSDTDQGRGEAALPVAAAEVQEGKEGWLVV